MHRRTVLKWLSGVLTLVYTSLIAIPGVGFVVEVLRRRSSTESRMQRVARLQDLQPGRPILVPVIGTRRDAWTTYPSETIGRVWLVRRRDIGGRVAVDAFTSVCPHLGCQIQLDAKANRFICPCHKAAFGQEGLPIAEQILGHRNHAPRGMDLLECRVVKDDSSDDLWVEVKYEKFEQGLTRKVSKT